MHPLSRLLSRLIYRISRKAASYDRIQYVRVGFLLFGAFILWTAFRLTVLEHDFYRTLADKQQTITVKNPVSRGTIYSVNTPAGVFATSTDLPDLAVDPCVKTSLSDTCVVGNRTLLITTLTDIVMFEYCGRDRSPNERCIESILGYVRLPKDENIEYTIDSLRTLVLGILTTRIEKPFLDFVLVKENLNADEIREAEAFNYEWVILLGGNLYVNPVVLKDSGYVSARFTNLFGIPPAEAEFLVKKRPLRYTKVLRRMSLATKDFVDTRLQDEKIAIQKWLITPENGMSGFIILEPNPTRFFPEKAMAWQITGFVDNDNAGRYGIESYFNDYLQGQQGERQTRKDAAGRTIGGYDLSEKKMVGGADIKLTIDRNIQKEISTMLADWVREFRANKGSVVVLDPKTGAVIAMANYPNYDPNDFGSVYDLEKVSYARYPRPAFDLLGMPVFTEDSEVGVEYTYLGRKIKLRPVTDTELGNTAIVKYKFKNNFGPGVYQNDVVSGLYEPGSVFKAMTTAIGIDTGDIKPNDTYFDRGFVEIDKYKISNVSKECLGRNTYSHALDWSCNVWMIDIAQKIGRSLFYKYIADFGFGNKTNITLDGETYGRIPSYEKWSRVDLFTASFGQGLITATPLQMAAAYVALANGGIYYEPYIVDSIAFGDGTVINNVPNPVRRVIKEETSKKIIAMLTEGAKIGFARKGWVDGYDIAGKTGTSQIATRGRYEEGGPGHTITSYGGFAPSSNPKFVMIVKIDRPRSAEFSETTSSALFSKIAKYLLNYYAIPKNS